MIYLSTLSPLFDCRQPKLMREPGKSHPDSESFEMSSAVSEATAMLSGLGRSIKLTHQTICRERVLFFLIKVSTLFADFGETSLGTVYKAKESSVHAMLMRIPVERTP